MPAERLQKILARAGAGSRRACETLIAEGRVSVDGEVVTRLGAKADPETQDIRLDGHRLRAEVPEYWIVNKPKGVVCTNRDPAGRPRAVDLMKETRARLFPVGRLDADSKGLLIMTNDGAFANRIAHPRYEVPKTYLATVLGRVTGQDIERLLRGVSLSEGRARTARVRVLKRGTSRSVLEITLREGRNRQIRRMLARLCHPVRDLVRTRIGRINLRGLGPGRARRLTPQEVKYLKELASKPASERKASRGAAAPKGGRKPRSIGGRLGPKALGGRPKKKRSRRKS